MNLQQQEHFYQMMTRVKMNSRAASSPHARITEMVNGLLVSKPAKKEPVVIDLQEYARSGKAAASVQVSIKLKKYIISLTGDDRSDSSIRVFDKFPKFVQGRRSIITMLLFSNLSLV